MFVAAGICRCEGNQDNSRSTRSPCPTAKSPRVSLRELLEDVVPPAPRHPDRPIATRTSALPRASVSLVRLIQGRTDSYRGRILSSWCMTILPVSPIIRRTGDDACPPRGHEVCNKDLPGVGLPRSFEPPKVESTYCLFTTVAFCSASASTQFLWPSEPRCAQHTAGESNRGKHSLSTPPRQETRGPLWRSESRHSPRWGRPWLHLTASSGNSVRSPARVSVRKGRPDGAA